MTLKLSVTVDADGFRQSIDETQDRFDQAFAVSKNMIASMMKTEVITDIKAAGNFNPNDVVVSIEGDTITTTVDMPGAALFETGGTIQGRPLLWLPISGTDAEGVQASSYGDQLFSVNRKAGGVPLLFSIKDHAPKYFGVSSVHIPQKFHIGEVQTRVMDNFKNIFEAALNG